MKDEPTNRLSLCFRRHRRWRLRSGLTLVEVVVAIGLAGVGLVLILACMGHVRHRERLAREQTMAWELIDQLQADLRLERTWAPESESASESWSAQGRLLESFLPLEKQNFGSREEPLVLAFGEDHSRLDLPAATAAYQDGLGEGTEAVALIAFWGSRRDAVMEVQARVEFPAALAASRRRGYEVEFAISLMR